MEPAEETPAIKTWRISPSLRFPRRFISFPRNLSFFPGRSLGTLKIADAISTGFLNKSEREKGRVKEMELKENAIPLDGVSLSSRARFIHVGANYQEAHR